MNISHVYWFAYFDKSEPSVRYRGVYPLSHLRRHLGIGSTMFYPGYTLSNIFRFSLSFFSLLLFRRKNSVIVIEKVHTDRLYAILLKFLLKVHRNCTVYDIDDADYLKFSPKNILYFMQHCEQCSVGSNALMEFTRQHNPNVFLLQSPVINHTFHKTTRNELFTIGWVGYYNAHRESLLRLLFPALLKLHFPVKVVLMGVTKEEHFKEIDDVFKDCKNVIIEMPRVIDWQDEQSVYRAISGFDIGVAPLLDTPLNKAKSAFKLKQYMSCGVPVLGSSIGENKNFLRHGYNGLICDNAEDYRNSIAHFYQMPEPEYLAYSTRALSTAQLFTVSVYCETFIEKAADR